MSLADEYPDNALLSALEGWARGIPRDMCYRPSPDRAVVCVRPRGHGVTAMRLPNGRRTYVDHCSSPDGSGIGWG